MPTKSDIDVHLKSLILNGFDFIEQSADEVEIATKFSVVHFATGVELLLKAVLFHEHWSLVSTKPHATPWSQVRDGNFMSIQASELTAAITSTVGTAITPNQQKVLATIFGHRNRVLHFIPSPDIKEAVGEQFRAWFHLARLFRSQWSAVFDHYDAQIVAIDARLRENAGYLDVRFKELSDQGKFKKSEAAGKLIDCVVCQFRSGEIDDETSPVTNMKCEVCVSGLEVANFGCGVWHSFSDGFMGRLSCSCGKAHYAADLATLMEEDVHLSIKDQAMQGETRLSCGECLEMHSVANTSGDNFRCFACGTDFTSESTDVCANCNEGWAGYDCEDSSWKGCEHCEGPDVDDDD